jgi:hypothetical protein
VYSNRDFYLNGIDEKTKLTSKFPDKKYPNYLQYFKEKYNLTFKFKD